ncbi:hypothetical protein PISMIDRAFT_88621, partial [Pisolithus microcarpus 441]
CFLHGINLMIGEILMTFFNSSHYWGGQLKDQTIRDNITHTLKQNHESCWYALILQAISVSKHGQPLMIICVCPDTMKTNGLSHVAPDVIDIVIHDLEFWLEMDQLIKTTEPLVDTLAIANPMKHHSHCAY